MKIFTKGNPSCSYAQKLKSILSLITIATLKQCPDMVTKLLYINRYVFTDDFLLTLSSHEGSKQTLWDHTEGY